MDSIFRTDIAPIKVTQGNLTVFAAAIKIVLMVLLIHFLTTALSQAKKETPMKKLGLILICLGMFTLSACSLSASSPPFGSVPTLTPTVDRAKPADPGQSATDAGVPTVTESAEAATATLEVLPPTATPTQVPPTATSTLEPSETPTPTPTEEAGPIPVGSAVNAIDTAELVLVPAGEFTMGSDPETDPNFWGAEGPTHTVTLDAYWIYKHEVTVGMYTSCYQAGYCPPAYLQTASHPDLEAYRGEADLPMVFVTWEEASFYCDWAADGLPTEAQWEKAARGTSEGLFPWGKLPFEEGFANYCGLECEDSASELAAFDDGYPLTAPVGSFPAGASPYGAMDMAGNVWEWTADYFGQSYYSISPQENPNGPATGDRYVIRGGGFRNGLAGLRVVARISLEPDAAMNTVGFRCVVNEE